MILLFKVVVTDNFFDKKLDPATLKVLHASHEYRIVHHSENSPFGPAVSFVFDDILLPDSTTNEPASHGFIKFRIKPFADIEDGQRVANTAFIDFDYEASIMTNTVVQRIFDKLLTSIYNSSPDLLSLSVYPNPASNMVKVSLRQNDPSGYANVLDITGKLIKKVSFNKNQFVLDLTGFMPGTYFLKVDLSDGSAGTASIIVH